MWFWSRMHPLIEPEGVSNSMDPLDLLWSQWGKQCWKWSWFISHYVVCIHHQEPSNSSSFLVPVHLFRVALRSRYLSLTWPKGSGCPASGRLDTPSPLNVYVEGVPEREGRARWWRNQIWRCWHECPESLKRRRRGWPRRSRTPCSLSPWWRRRPRCPGSPAGSPPTWDAGDCPSGPGGRQSPPPLPSRRRTARRQRRM